MGTMAMRWLAMLLLLLASLQGLADPVSLGRVAPSALFVVESIDAAGAGGLSATIQSGGSAGTGLGASGLQSVDEGLFVRAPVFALPASFASEAAAVDAVRAGVEPAIAAITAALRTTMASRHLAYGFYQYRRTVQVMVRGREETRTVVGSVVAGVDGGLRNLGWKISPGPQYVLYVVYEQLSVAQGLPADWARGNAGQVRWQLYEYDGSTLTAMGAITTVAANGRYDAPQPADDVEFDPNAGLDRLISEQVRPLMAGEQAVYAIVDYGRIVEPVYDDLPNGDSVARVAVQIDERRFTGDTCGLSTPTFAETGQIGWLLHLVVDRYLVMPETVGGQVSGLGRFEQSALSPTQPVSKSVTLATGSQAADFTSRIINPFPQNDAVYDWQNDTVNGLPADRYVSVAGLTVVNSRNDVAMWCGTVPGIGQVVANTATGSLIVNGNTVGWGNWRYVYQTVMPVYASDPEGNILMTGATQSTAIVNMVVPGFQPAGGDLTTTDTEYVRNPVNPDDPFVRIGVTWQPPQFRAVRFNASAPGTFRYVGGGWGFAFSAEFWNNGNRGPAGLVSANPDYVILPGNTSVMAAAYRNHVGSADRGYLDTYITAWQSQPWARLYRVNVSGNTNTYTPAD